MSPKLALHKLSAFFTDTLKELEHELEVGKRLSIGLPKYKFTSGDLGESTSQILKAEKSKQVAKVTAASSKKTKSDKRIRV